MRKRKDEQSPSELQTVKKVKTTTSNKDFKPSGTIDRFIKFQSQDENPMNFIPKHIPSLGMAIQWIIPIPTDLSCDNPG
eukprot:11634049-Heterocapsa_arctica.AAC.1